MRLRSSLRTPSHRAFAQGCEDGVVRDLVGTLLLIPHVGQKGDCMLPHAAFATCTDRRVEADGIRLQDGLPGKGEQGQG